MSGSSIIAIIVAVAFIIAGMGYALRRGIYVGSYIVTWSGETPAEFHDVLRVVPPSIPVPAEPIGNFGFHCLSE